MITKKTRAHNKDDGSRIGRPGNGWYRRVLIEPKYVTKGGRDRVPLIRRESQGNEEGSRMGACLTILCYLRFLFFLFFGVNLQKLINY